MFFSPKLNWRFFRYLVDIIPFRPLASIRYSNLMVPVEPSLRDQVAETGRPGLARCASEVYSSDGYGSKVNDSTFVPSKVFAPLCEAWRKIKSSDSERMTFHEKPPGPRAAAKSVTEVCVSCLVSLYSQLETRKLHSSQ
jgi:hypothetical protein